VQLKKIKIIDKMEQRNKCTSVQCVLSCISVHRHISVAPATIIENTNNIQMLAQNVSLKPPDVTGNVFHNFAHVSLRLSKTIKINIYIIIIACCMLWVCNLVTQF